MLAVNFRVLDAQLAQLVDQGIEVGEGLHLVLLIDQEIAGAHALLQQHDPLPGIARIGYQMGVELHPGGMPGADIFMWEENKVSS